MKLEEAKEQWKRDMQRRAARERAQQRKVEARRCIEDIQLARETGLTLREVQGL